MEHTGREYGNKHGHQGGPWAPGLLLVWNPETSWTLLAWKSSMNSGVQEQLMKTTSSQGCSACQEFIDVPHYTDVDNAQRRKK